MTDLSPYDTLNDASDFVTEAVEKVQEVLDYLKGLDPRQVDEDSLDALDRSLYALGDSEALIEQAIDDGLWAPGWTVDLAD